MCYDEVKQAQVNINGASHCPVGMISPPLSLTTTDPLRQVSTRESKWQRTTGLKQNCLHSVWCPMGRDKLRPGGTRQIEKTNASRNILQCLISVLCMIGNISWQVKLHWSQLFVVSVGTFKAVNTR